MYLPPVSPPSAEPGEPVGHSYGAVILPAGDLDHADLVAVLSGVHFSGWVAPPRDGWIVVLGDPGDGVVADERRGVIEVAALLAQRVPGPVLSARVRHDRQLGLVAWRAGEEVARYCSDPSREPGADEDVVGEPIGAEYAATFAELWDGMDAAEKLTELLEDELDPDSVFESERLRQVLRMLGLPAWIIAAGELPRRLPTGPRPSELTRLRAGRSGAGGRMVGTFVGRLRRRQHPPPVIADPPKGGGGMGFESWMY